MPKKTESVRLPPRTGIPFEGFEFARVASRLPVAQQLEGFLEQCTKSPSVNVALIKAEWGEGKTDAYERYLQPRISESGSFGYLVSASTIALHLGKVSETFPVSGTSAASFLASVFAALRDELRSRHLDYDKVPDYSGYHDGLEYVHAVLNKHLKDNDAKLFLFIDEFEEILNHPDAIQRFALSGIKELINGQLGLVHIGGAFAGRLHFVIAVTPYAYAKMHDDRELLQIFGSFASRPSTIDLPPITREEAFGFILDLLRYSYHGKLPNPIPFKTAGILGAMVAISQRNLRALVQLYVDVMTSAIRKDEVKTIDAGLLIDSLTNKELAVYGELHPCIDKDLLSRIEETLGSNKIRGKHCKDLFRLLVGEYKPFSVQELQARLGLGEADVHAIVDIVNQELGKLGLARAIIRLNPPRKETTTDSVAAELTTGGEEILLVESKMTLRSLRDSLVHMEFGNQADLKETIYFPYSDLDLRDVFDLSDADSAFMTSKIGRHFDQTARNRRFMISRQLAEQVFPSPTWLLLDFIADRSKRAELWREATKVFGQRILDLRDLVIEVTKYSPRVQIRSTPRPQGAYEVFYDIGGGRQIDVKAHITATTSLTEADVKDTLGTMKSKGSNMGIILHTSDMEDRARELIEANHQLLTLQVRRVRALQLLALALAREKDVEIATSALESRLMEVSREFDLEHLVDQWAKRLRDEGIIVDALSTHYGHSDKALADALTFSINYLGEALTSQELFERTAELRSFTIYRQGTPFAPLDIETIEELEKYLEDLATNGFLQKDRNKYEVAETVVERQIVRSLQKGPVSIEGLKNRFVVFSPNDAILDQVYLPILERKGLISLGQEISLQESRSMFRITKEAFQKYDERISALKSSRWWSYAVLSVSKEREDRPISIEIFDSFVRRIYSPIREGVEMSPVQISQRCHFVLALLQHFDQNLAKLIDAGLAQGEAFVDKAGRQLRDVTGKVSLLVQEYDRYCEGISFSANDVQEISALKDLRGKMVRLSETPLTKESASEHLHSLRRTLAKGEKPHFYFGKEAQEADFFNSKVCQLRDLATTLDDHITSATRIADEIEGKIRDVDDIRARTKGRLNTYRVEEKYLLSATFLAKITRFHEVPIKAGHSAVLTLPMVREFFSKVHETLTEYGGKISDGLDLLDEILEEEMSAMASLQNLTDKIEPLKRFFDLDDDISEKARDLLETVATTNIANENQIKEWTTKVNGAERIEQLVDTGRKAAQEGRERINKFSTIDAKRTGLERESLDAIATYHDKALNMIRILGAAGATVSPLEKVLSTVTSKANETLSVVFGGRTVDTTWGKLWGELYSIRDDIYSASQKILSSTEFAVLFSAVSAAKKGVWVATEELVEDISAEQKLPPKEVQDSLQALVEKKLLKEGVSLAM